MQAYNAQIAVDSHAQIIVAAELTQQAIRLPATVTHGEESTQHSPRGTNHDHCRCRLLGHTAFWIHR